MINWIIVGSILLIFAIVLVGIVNYRKLNESKQTANELDDIINRNDENYDKQYQYNYELKKIKHDLQKYSDYFATEEECDSLVHYSRVDALNRLIAVADNKCDELDISFEKCVQDEADAKLADAFSNEPTLKQSDEIRADDGQLDAYDNSPAADELRLVGIVGNLLDNSIEACARYGKRMKLSLACDEERVWLAIANTKDPKHLLKQTGNATTKVDASEHGYGEKIIDEMCAELGTKIERQDLGEEFEARIYWKVQGI